MAELTEETARELLDALEENRTELRRIRREGLVARLSDGERDEIARQVFELVDERLAPADERDADDAPGRQRHVTRDYFTKRRD
jgi:hypothetical protein